MANKRIVGVSPWSNPNYPLMKEGGIEWLRVGFGFPFKDKLHGEYTAEFLTQLEEAKAAARLGFKLMGVTPLPGQYTYDKSDNKNDWRVYFPDWVGSHTEDRYYDAYEQACEEMARLTKDIVQLWQVSNEMDGPRFYGPMSREQVVRFLWAGASGLRKGSPEALPGINPARLMNHSRWLYKQLHGPANTPMGYAGIDGYFGSWIPGEPQDWVLWLQEIHDLTRQDVLVNEWGYSAIGGPPKPPPQVVTVGRSVCEARAWHNVWKTSHTPEEQADYVRIGLKIFATYPHVLGSFLYDWGDDPVCLHCGRTECPSECGWGIVDIAGKPKPGYYALKETVARYY